ncbi:MAG TPA: glutaredoxin 3 [Alphaproteobacteria bacterium]|nr:glutaredoxin 3 [Alphaproteobacteria bacterium]
MPDVTIYTTGLCGFCYRAKALLDSKGVAFDEIDVTFNPKKRAEMSARAGGANSVPQIWIGERHIGGSDELYTLEAQGELDALLANTA